MSTRFWQCQPNSGPLPLDPTHHSLFSLSLLPSVPREVSRYSLQWSNHSRLVHLCSILSMLTSEQPFQLAAQWLNMPCLPSAKPILPSCSLLLLPLSLHLFLSPPLPLPLPASSDSFSQPPLLNMYPLSALSLPLTSTQHRSTNIHSPSYHHISAAFCSDVPSPGKLLSLLATKIPMEEFSLLYAQTCLLSCLCLLFFFSGPIFRLSLC